MIQNIWAHAHTISRIRNWSLYLLKLGCEGVEGSPKRESLFYLVTFSLFAQICSVEWLCNLTLSMTAPSPSAYPLFSSLMFFPWVWPWSWHSSCYHSPATYSLWAGWFSSAWNVWWRELFTYSCEDFFPACSPAVRCLVFWSHVWIENFDMFYVTQKKAYFPL